MSYLALNENKLEGPIPDLIQLTELKLCEFYSSTNLCHLKVPEDDICDYASAPKCESDCLVVSEWLSMDKRASNINACCSDSRVTCDANNRITEFDARLLNISGVIPNSISSLEQLVKLYYSLQH